MKYVVVIVAGAADEPVEALDGRTPLEVAETPNLSRLASAGRVGCAWTIPEDVGASPEVGAMSVLGYDPLEHACGRAGLEAVAAGVELGAGERVWRLSFASVDEQGVVLESAARGLTEAEGRALAVDLLAFWSRECGETGLELVVSAAARQLLVDRSARWGVTVTTPPAAMVGEPVGAHAPSGGGAGRLKELVERGHGFLSEHEVNLARVEQGLPAANLPWLWGAGEGVRLENFQKRFGKRGLVFSGDEAVAGLAISAGMDRLPVFCGLEEDPLGLGALAEGVSDGLRRADMVCCYVGDALDASLRGDWLTKVRVLEEVDRQLIGPVMSDLSEQYGDPAVDPGSEGWRLLVIPDCTASSTTRRVLGDEVPFVIGGAWVRSAVKRRFIERDSVESDLQVEEGHLLMEYFLRGGLAGVRAR